jgi:hypothetical protein
VLRQGLYPECTRGCTRDAPGVASRDLEEVTGCLGESVIAGWINGFHYWDASSACCPAVGERDSPLTVRVTNDVASTICLTHIRTHPSVLGLIIGYVYIPFRRSNGRYDWQEDHKRRTGELCHSCAEGQSYHSLDGHQGASQYVGAFFQVALD